MTKFDFLKIYFSPFKRPIIHVYFGPIKIGVPIFLPRKKIGFNFVGLGWKTKWNESDYRYEWPPVWSFVFYKWQIAIIFLAPIEFHDPYWTAWLYYRFNINHDLLSTRLQVETLIKEFPLIYKIFRSNPEPKSENINYYFQILKSKYHSYV